MEPKSVLCIVQKSKALIGACRLSDRKLIKNLQKGLWIALGPTSPVYESLEMEQQAKRIYEKSGYLFLWSCCPCPD